MKTEQNEAEIKSIEDSILLDYGNNIPFHKEVLYYFIRDCLDIGLKEEDIYRCFHELYEHDPHGMLSMGNFREEKLIDYINFPRVYLWNLAGYSSCIDKYINDIVEKKYFQQEKRKELVKEICDYYHENAKDFESTCDEHNNYVTPKKHFHEIFPISNREKLLPAELLMEIYVALRNTKFQSSLEWEIKRGLKIDGYTKEKRNKQEVKKEENNKPQSQTEQGLFYKIDYAFSFFLESDDDTVDIMDWFEYSHRIYPKCDLLAALLKTTQDENIIKEVEKIINDEAERLKQKIHQKNIKQENKQRNKQQDIEIDGSEPIIRIPLPKEMSDEEIMGKIREDGSYFLERATEEQNVCVYNFMLDKIGIKLWSGKTDEEFIEFIFNTEMLKESNCKQPSFSNRNYMSKRWRKEYLEKSSDLEIISHDFTGMYNRLNDDKNILWNKINNMFSRKDSLIERILKIQLHQIGIKEIKIKLLLVINTKKSFCAAWELLGKDRNDHNSYTVNENRKLYILIINRWDKYFLMNLIRKELIEENKTCIMAILNSRNEYAIRFLFVCAWYNLVFENREFAFFKGTDFFYYESDNYYINLCCILFTDINSINDDEFAFYRDVYKRFNKNYSINLNDLLKQNNIFSKKIKKIIDDIELNWHEKITSENFENIGSIIDKTPISMKSWNYMCCCMRLWLNEGKTQYLNDFLQEILQATEEEIIICRNVMLEKPFKISNYSVENENIMKILFKNFNFKNFTEENFSEIGKYKDINLLWKEYFQKCIENIANEYEQPKFPKINIPLEQEYSQYLLSRANDIFSTTIENISYNEYKVFLTESRKLQINKLLKKGVPAQKEVDELIAMAEKSLKKGVPAQKEVDELIAMAEKLLKEGTLVQEETDELIAMAEKSLKKWVLVQEEADKLIAMAENPEMNYYAWSDKDITSCLLPGTYLEKLHADLEPEFMVRIFEKSILWVIEHRDSELWQNAPWFGMQIFNKSYADRPTIWAKQLIKIADEWTGSESMLLRICFALGHLRELLGGEIHVVLQKIADKQEYSNIKDKILIQKSLFDRGNFNKGHHRTPFKRVELCKEELIKGQNREILKE